MIYPCMNVLPLLLFVGSIVVPASVSAADSRPNILFCIMDDASYMHMSAYGCEWTHTPSFDRLANEGILFQNAYTPNAKCAPSRSSILTGRNSWQLEEAANHIVNFPANMFSADAHAALVAHMSEAAKWHDICYVARCLRHQSFCKSRREERELIGARA